MDCSRKQELVRLCGTRSMNTPIQFDVCIPVNHNLRCLRTAMRGWRRYLQNKDAVGKVLLHIQHQEEAGEATLIVANAGFRCEIASHGTEMENMVHPMNRMLAASTARWVVMTEQDMFLRYPPDILVSEIEREGFIVAAPVDTFYYDNINARKWPGYGRYGRLSGEPGHYHSSLMVINREAVAARTATPFTHPDMTKLHCYGCLGGELYYGLRANAERSRGELGFFRQTHAPFGYSADISFQGRHLGTHLYYSSHQEGYVQPGGHLNMTEAQWLESEEVRFLDDYERHLP